jgi:hypothetical protein
MPGEAPGSELGPSDLFILARSMQLGRPEPRHLHRWRHPVVGTMTAAAAEHADNLQDAEHCKPAWSAHLSDRLFRYIATSGTDPHSSRLQAGRRLASPSLWSQLTRLAGGYSQHLVAAARHDNVMEAASSIIT